MPEVAAPDVPPSPSAETKKREWPKKALAITTVVGTVAASILGASWLHRKRKEKSSPGEGARPGSGRAVM